MVQRTERSPPSSPITPVLVPLYFAETGVSHDPRVPGFFFFFFFFFSFVRYVIWFSQIWLQVGEKRKFLIFWHTFFFFPSSSSSSFFFFFFQFCDVGGLDRPQEELAKFGYRSIKVESF